MDVLRPIRHVIDALCAATLAGIAALAFFQVVARYVLGVSTPWSEELLRLLFVWLVLLGASRSAHMRVDMLDQAVATPTRRILVLGRTIVAGALLLLLVVKGFDLIELTVYDRYTALPLSVQWLYWSLVVGGGLWLVFLLAETTTALRRGE